MKITKTKERILDAAEVLFARNGFHATSVRDITSSAGVTLAAVNYYFGTKEGLFEKVLERGILSLVSSFREKLDAIREGTEEGGTPEIEGVLSAILEPMLSSEKPKGVSSEFYVLLGRVLISPHSTTEVWCLKPLFLLLYENLREIRPTFPGKILTWRLRFALAAIGHALQGSVTELLFNFGVDSSCDSDELLSMLINFLAAGIEAPVVDPLSQTSVAVQTSRQIGYEPLC